MRFHKYRRPKRGGSFWMDVRLNGCRYREPLGTIDKGEADELMLKRIEQLKNKAPDVAKTSKSFGSMDIPTAIEAYILARKAQVSPRMVCYWRESASALSKINKAKLKAITPAHITSYQSARLEQGKAAKTINGELSVLRQLLKHAKLWYRFEDYKAIRNHKPAVGRALTEVEQQRLFAVAQSREDWLYAYTAGVLGAFCGMRGCEIKALQWKNIDFATSVLDIRHSKTSAGLRAPTLNSICREALATLKAKAVLLDCADPDHYCFPSQKKGKIDATKHAMGWRSAWRSIRSKAARNDEGEVIYPGLEKIRFHDMRHTAVTTMAEKGLADHVIMAQVGHVSPQMMKHYSHVRRQALNTAAAALEPEFFRPSTQPLAAAELVN